MTVWTEDNVARLKTMWADNQPVSEIAETMGATKRSILGKVYRLGLHLRHKGGNTKVANGRAAPTVNVQRARRRAKKAPAPTPALSPIYPPFLPPVPLTVEYVPTGRTPVTLLASGDFVCKNFLPDQDRVEAPYRLVCGNPVPEGARFMFCGACGEAGGLYVKPKAPTLSTYRRAA